MEYFGSDVLMEVIDLEFWILYVRSDLVVMLPIYFYRTKYFLIHFEITFDTI